MSAARLIRDYSPYLDGSLKLVRQLYNESKPAIRVKLTKQRVENESCWSRARSQDNVVMLTTVVLSHTELSYTESALSNIFHCILIINFRARGLELFFAKILAAANSEFVMRLEFWGMWKENPLSAHHCPWTWSAPAAYSDLPL